MSLHVVKKTKQKKFLKSTLWKTFGNALKIFYVYLKSQLHQDQGKFESKKTEVLT